MNKPIRMIIVIISIIIILLICHVCVLLVDLLQLSNYIIILAKFGNFRVTSHLFIALAL